MNGILILSFSLLANFYLNVAEIIPNQYIVAFQSGTSESQRNEFYDKYFYGANEHEENGVEAQLLKKFNINEEFIGFSAIIPKTMLKSIQMASIISYVQNDETVELYDASCMMQSEAPWGLNRICQRDLNLDGKYHYKELGGEGVSIYILDTGININHEDFGGRAVWGANTADDGIDDDCNGHGTHVAGIAGGNTWGVAKNAAIVAVKSVGCDSDTISATIEGLDWIVKDHKAHNHPSVIKYALHNGTYHFSMSMGSRKGTFDAAVKATINAGITFIAAAGNHFQDACLVRFVLQRIDPKGSPACVPEAITVAGTGVKDENSQLHDIRASYSNYGTCVDIFSPGDLIESAYIGSTTATKVMSGTSMSSPFVAGVAALYLAAVGNVSPAQVSSFLMQQATEGKIDLLCSEKYVETEVCLQTPNKLLFAAC